MEDTAKPLVMDMELCIDYVANKTGIDKDTVEKVLMAETDYMIELNIIQVDPIEDLIEETEEDEI